MTSREIVFEVVKWVVVITVIALAIVSMLYLVVLLQTEEQALLELGRPLVVRKVLLGELEEPEGRMGVRTFAILTSPANEPVATIHDRMPAILAPRGSICTDVD